MKQLGFGSPWYLVIVVGAVGLWYADAHRQVFVGLRWPKIFRLWASRHELDLTTPIAAPTARWRFWLGLALLGIALAQPRMGYLQVPLQDAPKEIVVALDLSKSMLARDVKPSRLEHAKLLVQSLLDKMAGDRVALLLFAGSSYLQLPLSTDYEIMAGFLPNLTPEYFSEGGTNFEAMLKTSLDGFGTGAGTERFLVVLSDGETFDEKWTPLVDQLAQRNIHVLGVGIGTTAGGVMPLSDGQLVKDSSGNEAVTHLKADTLEQLAKRTGGSYTNASGWVDMHDLLTQAATASAGKKGSKSDPTRLEERFQWFLIPAALLLAWSFWRELPVRPRARDIKVPPPIAEAPKPRRGVAAATATIALLLFVAVTFPDLRAQDMGDMEDATQAQLNRLPMNSLGNLVAQRIQDILTKKSPGAYDYVSLVIDSVAYMETMLKARQRFPLSVIVDCNLAISMGEQLDIEGGDWQKLRADLVRLRQADIEPWKTAAPDAAGKADVATSFDPDHDMKSAQSKGPGNPSADYDAGVQSTAAAEKKKIIAGSAFGDMTGEQPQMAPPATVAVAPGAQQIGGEKSDLDEEREDHPELALPLQKLEHVRNQDSPAKLFQMLEGNKNYLVTQGPDW